MASQFGVCVCVYSGASPINVPWKKANGNPHAGHRLSTLRYHLTHTHIHTHTHTHRHTHQTASNNSVFIKH